MKNPNAIMLNIDYLKNMNLQKVPYTRVSN